MSLGRGDEKYCYLLILNFSDVASIRQVQCPSSLFPTKLQIKLDQHLWRIVKLVKVLFLLYCFCLAYKTC